MFDTEDEKTRAIMIVIQCGVSIVFNSLIAKDEKERNALLRASDELLWLVEKLKNAEVKQGG